MATKFLEPGGDADFALDTSGNGFWDTKTGSPAIVTDHVHGGHIKSISYPGSGYVGKNQVLSGAGSRVSFYLYIVALPNATSSFFSTTDHPVSAFTSPTIAITSGGVLQILASDSGAQIGTNGATLSTGTWYRISLAYTYTSTTVNRFELFVNSVSSISITNATFSGFGGGTGSFWIGNLSGNAGLDMRSSDHYIDNSSS